MKIMEPTMCRLCLERHWARAGCAMNPLNLSGTASPPKSGPKVAKADKAAVASAKPPKRKVRRKKRKAKAAAVVKEALPG